MNCMILVNLAAPFIRNLCYYFCTILEVPEVPTTLSIVEEWWAGERLPKVGLNFSS